jgi:hypothetical protein
MRSDHAIVLWAMGATPRLLTSLMASESGVSALAWHPRGAALVSASASGSVLWWRSTRFPDWQPFSPHFPEMRFSVEYAEHEDEFDAATEADMAAVMEVSRRDDSAWRDVSGRTGVRLSADELAAAAAAAWVPPSLRPAADDDADDELPRPALPLQTVAVAQGSPRDADADEDDPVEVASTAAGLPPPIVAMLVPDLSRDEAPPGAPPEGARRSWLLWAHAFDSPPDVVPVATLAGTLVFARQQALTAESRPGPPAAPLPAPPASHSTPKALARAAWYEGWLALNAAGRTQPLQ